MTGRGFVKVIRDGLRGPAAEQGLFLELCARASVKARVVCGVKVLRGQALASTRELGEAIGKCPAFVFRHLRKMQATGLIELKQVTLPRPVNRSKIRMLLTVPSLAKASETSGVKSETSGETSREGSGETSQTANNALIINRIKKPNSCEETAVEIKSETSGETSGAESETSGQFIPIIYSSKNEIIRMNTTTSFVPPSAVPAEAAEAGATKARGLPRRATRGRLTRHDAPKKHGEGEKTARGCELVEVLGREENKPQNPPLSAKATAADLEAEIRGLMADDRVRYQLRAKSGGMDEATASSLVPEFAGQMELEGKEEHGMRLAMHFAYWLGKKKIILENQQKRADGKQKRAEADRRDLELLYNYMRS